LALGVYPEEGKVGNGDRVVKRPPKYFQIFEMLLTARKL
jgi:hypothetical protein